METQSLGPSTLMTRLLGVSIVFLAVLPFTTSTDLPASDLGQHVAQLRLVFDALGGTRPELEIAWGAPGTGIYLVMLVFATVLPMAYVGWATLVVLVAAWAAALTWVAVRRGRDLASALIAGTFIFGACVYWGLLQFMVGWPLLLVWFMVVESWRRGDGPGGETRHLLRLFATALALYLSHTMWLPVALLWLLVRLPGARLNPRRFGRLCLALAPVLLVSIHGYIDVIGYRASLPSKAAELEWRISPWERLGFSELRHLALGGLRGALEPILLAISVAWMSVGVVGALYRRFRPAEGLAPSNDVDGPLLGLAAIPATIALFAPDQFLITILTPERFAGGAIMLLLLALPAPRLRGRGGAIPRVVAWVAAAGFSLMTTASWRLFADECEGLDEAIEQLPEGQRVLGLDFASRSSVVLGRPFMHMVAFAQARRGGQINFSFADFGAGIVRTRHPAAPKWSPLLEWEPHRVGDRDLQHFDYVLINADEETHARFLAFSKGQALQSGTRFRLIRLPKAP